jgi:hypothetical protein
MEQANTRAAVMTVGSAGRCRILIFRRAETADNQLISLVPVERIELPTFGLQNRCSTAELNRRIEESRGLLNMAPNPLISGGPNTRLVRKGLEPL